MTYRPVGPRAAVIALTAAAALAVASATAPADEGASIFRADLVPYTSARSGVVVDSGVSARATVVAPAAKDTATVRMHAAGLTPGQSYGVHVHFGGCSDFRGHFRYVAEPGTRPNEVWLDLEANPAGRAHDQVKVPRFAAAGLSLVIHEKANPDRVADPFGFPGRRIACGNLLPQP